MLRKISKTDCQRFKKRRLKSNMDTDVNDDNEAQDRWNALFQHTLKIDASLEDTKIFSFSENGVDVEITQQQLDKCLGYLVSAHDLYVQFRDAPLNFSQKQFLLATAGYIARYEQHFNKLNSKRIFKMLMSMMDVKNVSTHHKLKSRYVDLLRSFFEHDSGLRWLIEMNSWTDIHELVIECQNGEEEGNMYNLLSKILQKASKVAPKICLHIIRQVTQNLMTVALKNVSQTKQEPVIPLPISESSRLLPYSTCVVEILERLLAGPTVDILSYFVKLQIREACDTLSMLTNNTEFSLKLDRIVIILSFYEMTDLFDGIKVVNHDPIALSGFLQIVEREMNKEHINTILELFYYAQKYWKCVCRKMPKYFVKEKPIDIEDELMSFQVEPIVVIAEKLFGVPMTAEEELRNCFLADLLNLYSVNCLQLGYEIRKHLAKLPLQTEITALDCLIKSKHLYSRKNLAIVFQVLIYCLRDFTRYVKKYPTQGKFDQDQQFADKLLRAIVIYLENFDLSWRESIGSIELTCLVYQFLYYSTQWPPQVVRKALEILNTTISKHMSPNMALLVDTTQNSSLSELGSLLFTKCFSTDSEVRNSSLTVVCTICHKANKGFTSFKRIIEEALLPDLILTMALRDLDCNVRATALKCLQEIIEMKETGQCLLKNGLVDKIIGVFSNEDNSVVIREAIILIGKMYRNNNVAQNDISNIYTSLLKLAIEENLEIQQYAVEFWEQVIRNQLEKQGMIDDEFPPVIFSKECRKIVKLDDKEIRKRLFKALDNMSGAGCFNVFQKILKQEPSTKKVFRSVVNIVTKLLNLLQQYEVTPEFILFNQTYPNLWSIQSIMSPSNQTEGDDKMKEIIEDSVMEMINESEYCAINKIHSPYTETNSENGEPQERAPFNQHNRVSTVDFMDFLYKKLPNLNQDSLEICSNNNNSNIYKDVNLYNNT